MKKKVAYVFMAIMIIALGTYLYSGFTYAMTQVNVYQLLLQIGGIGIITFSIIFAMFFYNRKNKISISHSLSSFLLTIFLIISSCNYLNVLSLPVRDTLPNFYNMNIQDAKEWADNFEIEIIEQYENSDVIEKYHVFGQSVNAGTLIDDVKTLELIISDGPNYDKSIVIPQMLGWTLDEVKEFIKENFLTHVNITFQHSEEEQYIVIEQDRYGKMFRRDEINLNFSLNENMLKDIAMIDLTNQSEFEATLWLMMNGIPYTITRDFSSSVDRDFVISQSIKASEIVNKDSNVELVISKGKEIVVPNLTKMSVKEVTQWIIDNNLDITFTDAYDDTVDLGSIIRANYQENDVIEEGTLIEIVTSKGQLKMESFNSLREFKSWAELYNVKYKEVREFHNTIQRGNIISFSHKVGDIIKNGETITVTISKGKAVTVPNFKGKTKSKIVSECNQLNLSCSFSYGSYGSVAKDTATSQSVSSGSVVEIGTAIQIVLSKGPAKTYTLYFSNALLGNSYNSTVSSLSSYFSKNYPGVNFKFVAKSHASLAPGNIHEDSPTKPGATVQQGKTYTIYVVK
ncbi:MAG: PASTA domain-containing protein [Erysipelotrichaceae bacterium]|nr:PASTA domain-containing protein [Erysipelotrichaceae bacterium]